MHGLLGITSAYLTCARSGGTAADALHAIAVVVDVVVLDALALGALDLVDLAVVARDGLSRHAGFGLEAVRLVGVAIVPIQHPVQSGGAGGAGGSGGGGGSGGSGM